MPFSSSRKDHSASRSQKKYAAELLKFVSDGITSKADTKNAWKIYFENLFDHKNETDKQKIKGGLEAFINTLMKIFYMKLRHHRDYMSKSSSKDTIAEVLEANGVTYRKVLILLVLSVAVLILLFVLIWFWHCLEHLTLSKFLLHL